MHIFRSVRTNIKQCVLIVLLITLGFSCGKRRQVVNEGDYYNADSTVFHWKEYIDHDSFFREVQFDRHIVNLAKAKSEKDFRDSSFSETDFFDNGRLKAQRTFVMGKQNGLWKSWYENGKQKSSSLVNNGLLRDYFSYYENGSIAVTASRQENGMMSRTERWMNGNLKEEFHTDSTGNGTCINYHENGKKSAEGQLLRFSPDGNWQRWDSTGTALADTTYGVPQTH